MDANWRLGRPLDFLPPRQLKNASSVFQLLMGVDGELPFRDWTWEVYATHGESNIDNGYVGFASLERYRAVVQAPNYGKNFSQTGAGQSRATCTSGLPIFEQFEVSQDCIDAITIDAADRTRLSQNIFEANLQGAVMNLPAGELRSAVGATYRKNDFEFRPDATRETNSIIDIPVSTFAAANVSGSTRVAEAYAELLIPLLKQLTGGGVAGTGAGCALLQLRHRGFGADVQGAVQLGSHFQPAFSGWVSAGQSRAQYE